MTTEKKGIDFIDIGIFINPIYARKKGLDFGCPADGDIYIAQKINEIIQYLKEINNDNRDS